MRVEVVLGVRVCTRADACAHVCERERVVGEGGPSVPFSAVNNNERRLPLARPGVVVNSTLFASRCRHAPVRVCACISTFVTPLPRTQRWTVVLMRSLEREASRFSAERVEAAKIMLALVQVGGRDAPAQFAPAGC